MQNFSTRRGKGKSKPDLFGAPTAFLLLAVIALALSDNSSSRFLLAFIFVGLIALYLLSKLYRRWVELQRYSALRLADIDNMDGIEFECYVACLLEHQGFKTNLTKRSNDFGADIIAEKDSIRYAVQCKLRGETVSVSREAVSDAVGAKPMHNCVEAMVVTNRVFTAGAKKYAKVHGCDLIDRNALADWIQDFQR